jgi:hypothetical protein
MSHCDKSDKYPKRALRGEVGFDGSPDQVLLGATAIAVIGYFALIYGSCARDLRCHLRPCGRHICGVSHDVEGAPRPR